MIKIMSVKFYNHKIFDNRLFDFTIDGNAVNNIIQSKNTGEFIMTTVDGSFCHLSRANLDIHINRERKKMKMKN